MERPVHRGPRTAGDGETRTRCEEGARAPSVSGEDGEPGVDVVEPQ